MDAITAIGLIASVLTIISILVGAAAGTARFLKAHPDLDRDLTSISRIVASMLLQIAAVVGMVAATIGLLILALYLLLQIIDVSRRSPNVVVGAALLVLAGLVCLLAIRYVRMHPATKGRIIDFRGRSVVAVVGIALCVLSIVVVGHSPVISGLLPARSSSISRDQATATAFIATVSASKWQGSLPPLPYEAKAPGPRCDSGGMPWETLNQNDLQCFADHTQVTGSLSDNTCTTKCTAREIIQWPYTDLHVIPSYFVESIRISGLTRGTTAFIGFENDIYAPQTRVLYEFNLGADGSFSAMYCINAEAGCNPNHTLERHILYTGHAGPGLHTFSVSLRKGGIISWGLDGSTLIEIPEQPEDRPADSTTALYLGIDTDSPTPSGQADFADFTLTAA